MLTKKSTATGTPKGATVVLEDKELWTKFHENTTEMLVNVRGKRLHPELKLSVSGLKAKQKYRVWLEFASDDDPDMCWKWDDVQEKWNLEPKALRPGVKGVKYIGPKYEKYACPGTRTGAQLMGEPLCFPDMLVSNDRNSRDDVVLEGEKRYIPVVHIEPIEMPTKNVCLTVQERQRLLELQNSNESSTTSTNTSTGSDSTSKKKKKSKEDKKLEKDLAKWGQTEHRIELAQFIATQHLQSTTIKTLKNTHPLPSQVKKRATTSVRRTSLKATSRSKHKRETTEPYDYNAQACSNILGAEHVRDRNCHSLNDLKEYNPDLEGVMGYNNHPDGLYSNGVLDEESLAYILRNGALRKSMDPVPRPRSTEPVMNNMRYDGHTGLSGGNSAFAQASAVSPGSIGGVSASYHASLQTALEGSVGTVMDMQHTMNHHHHGTYSHSEFGNSAEDLRYGLARNSNEDLRYGLAGNSQEDLRYGLHINGNSTEDLRYGLHVNGNSTEDLRYGLANVDMGVSPGNVAAFEGTHRQQNMRPMANAMSDFPQEYAHMSSHTQLNTSSGNILPPGVAARVAPPIPHKRPTSRAEILAMRGLENTVHYTDITGAQTYPTPPSMHSTNQMETLPAMPSISRPIGRVSSGDVLTHSQSTRAQELAYTMRTNMRSSFSGDNRSLPQHLPGRSKLSAPNSSGSHELARRAYSNNAAEASMQVEVGSGLGVGKGSVSGSQSGNRVRAHSQGMQPFVRDLELAHLQQQQLEEMPMPATSSVASTLNVTPTSLHTEKGGMAISPRSFGGSVRSDEHNPLVTQQIPLTGSVMRANTMTASEQGPRWHAVNAPGGSGLVDNDQRRHRSSSLSAEVPELAALGSCRSMDGLDSAVGVEPLRASASSGRLSSMGGVFANSHAEDVQFQEQLRQLKLQQQQQQHKQQAHHTDGNVLRSYSGNYHTKGHGHSQHPYHANRNGTHTHNHAHTPRGHLSSKSVGSLATGQLGDTENAPMPSLADILSQSQKLFTAPQQQAPPQQHPHSMHTHASGEGIDVAVQDANTAPNSSTSASTNQNGGKAGVNAAMTGVADMMSQGDNKTANQELYAQFLAGNQALFNGGAKVSAHGDARVQMMGKKTATRGSAGLNSLGADLALLSMMCPENTLGTAIPSDGQGLEWLKDDTTGER